MTPATFIIMLIAAIIILTVLTLKFKMHPVMTLFITAVFIGLVSGKSLVDTFSSITDYFGSTLGSIGVMIIFGAVIASGISDTGAATSIVNFFIRLFRGKHLELAPALTGFIMSIPVFGDIAIILNYTISAKDEYDASRTFCKSGADAYPRTRSADSGSPGGLGDAWGRCRNRDTLGPVMQRGILCRVLPGAFSALCEGRIYRAAG